MIMPPISDPRLEALRPGDVIEIRYHAGVDAEHMPARWIAAEVVVCEPDCKPIVRLSDGQITELRSFMTWHVVGDGTDLAQAA